MKQELRDRDEILRGDAAREALRIIARLREEGFVAYMAGGCVRDALLGLTPKDYDVATNATPDAVRKVFGRSRTLAFGASFGVIGVLPELPRVRDTEDEAVQPTEVATFRSDGTYSDGRRPDSVHFGEAKEDALRRDFTINGLFYDPEAHQIVDYVEGESDLDRRLLRTIGDASERIEEDKLRMLRAVRFATTLGFTVADATIKAIQTHADSIVSVSGERIGAEMRRVLQSENAPRGLRELQRFGLADSVLPELADVDGQKYEAILAHLDQRSFAASLACMLITIELPIKALDGITSRWKLSNEEHRMASAAVEHRGTIRDAARLPWSAVQPTLTNRDIDTIVSVAAAEVAADDADPAGLDRVRAALKQPAEELDPPPLLTGNDLRELGIPAGPVYQIILQSLRDDQLDGKILSRQDAVEHALSFEPN